ncbi:GATA zinc finger protein [Colletotrichum somersetense]|nr:GATA zinc finger protein [Colletotrichum somersetense]
MACSETRTVVRTTNDLTIPIWPPIDTPPAGPFLSSDVDSPPCLLVPLSLNQLKAGEIIQRVHGDANNLLCGIEGLLQCRARLAAATTTATTGAGHVVPKSLLGNPALLTVQRLSRDITGDMGELIALSRREATLAVRDSDQARRMRHHRRVIEGRYGAATRAQHHQHKHPETDGPVQLVCHTCNTRRTPQWRNGPAGPCTLCNVCGLVHAMRMRKLGRTRSKKASASSYTS